MTEYAKPVPRADDRHNAPYWQAAREHRLVLQRCRGCGHFRFPAAPICPACHGREASWEEAQGRGVVESFCRFHKAYWPGFAPDLPYAVVQVRLDNGVRFYSNLIGAGEPRIGMRVEVAFDDVAPGTTLVKFRPASIHEQGDSR
jgi:hypothetical protein